MAFQHHMTERAGDGFWRERVFWALVAPYVKKGVSWPAPRKPRILEDRNDG